MTPNVAKLEVLIRRLAYVTGLIGPLTALPQALSIWMSHQAAGISLWSEMGFTAIAGVWLTYGIVLRQGPIVLSSCLWMLFDAAIICGVLRFGAI